MTTRMTSLRRSAAAVALTGLLALGLAACGNGDSGSDASSSPTASATATPSQTPKPTQTTAAPAAEGDLAGFCNAATAMAGAATLDQSDPAAMAQQLAELTATFDGVTPPSEVAAEWTTVTTFYTTVNDAVAAFVANPNDTAALTTLTDAATKMSENGVIDAAMKIGMYAQANCK